MKFLDTEHDKISMEIIKQYGDYKLMEQSYKFGVASVLASLHDLCDNIEKNCTYRMLTPREIRKVFDGFLDNDNEVKAIFTRLMQTDYKKDDNKI